MKITTARLPSSLPRPVFVIGLFLGVLSTIAAALVPFERFGSRTSPEPVTLTFDRGIDAGIGEDLITVSFSLPPSSDSDEALEDEGDPEAAIDPDLVLRAIAQVESQGNPQRVGSLGERGLYQFRRATWRQHTREDFRRAHHPEISTTVARRHYQWIAQALRARGFQGTPYEVALAWNAGLSRVISGTAPSRAHHYAQRVANLASES